MPDSKIDPNWPIIPAGVWLDIRMMPLASLRPALFMDRDGVIVSDTGYISDPETVSLVLGTAELIRIANRANVPVLVVTNQSGIDRGLFGWADFAAIEARIAKLLAKEGAGTDATAACPFHPDHTTGYGDQHAHWRKPAAGLIKVLGDRLGIALSRSWMIGDKPLDIELARNAELAGAFLIDDANSPKAIETVGEFTTPNFVVHCVQSCAGAVERMQEAGLV